MRIIPKVCGHRYGMVSRPKLRGRKKGNMFSTISGRCHNLKIPTPAQLAALIGLTAVCVLACQAWAGTTGEDILRATGVKYGLIVHLGCGDARRQNETQTPARSGQAEAVSRSQSHQLPDETESSVADDPRK